MRKSWLSGAAFWPVGAVFAPEDGSGSGGGEQTGGNTPVAGGDSGAKPDAGSVLFPNEGKADDAKPAGDKPEGEQGEPDDKTTEGEAAGWKPYADDPAKSKEENDKAREAHELTNPDNPINKVPDDGKYEFKMPDGVALDEKLSAAMSPVLKDIGITRAQAQKLVDVFAEQQRNSGEEFAKSPTGIMFASMNAYNAEYGQPDKWADMAAKDKEIGGAAWDGSVKTAQAALAKFGTPALKDFLLSSNAGNHPEVIRLMARVGAAVSEDRPAGGDGGSGKPVEAAHVLFPDDKPKG